MQTAHFVLTRFNVPLSFARQNYGLDDQWLEHRFALFENFCLPSVAAQTKRDFHWMLLIDEKTSDRWRTRLEQDVKELPQAHIIPTPACSEAFFVRE
ncbi:MAG: hypothetical protein JWO95_2166, partial [Verrucomicrobiales bacterium]|nr:hypothetical protein [Verrucomicrobiales bacterium]